MIRNLYIFCVSCSLLHIFRASNLSMQDYKDLREYIFDINGYDKYVKPRENQNEAVDVKINIYLEFILGMDAVSQTLKTRLGLEISWTDDSLVWYKTKFKNISQLFIPNSDIWKPDLQLFNGVSETGKLGSRDTFVDVNNTGNVDWYVNEVFESTCNVNVQDYPYDKQECSIYFISESSGKGYLYIVAREISTLTMHESAEWLLLNADVRVDRLPNAYMVVVTLKLERKTTFIFINMILPAIILGILDIFTFMLPATAGEKMSYTVTIFLSFAVFLNIASSMLPASSTAVPLLSIYLLYHLAQGALIIIITSCQLRLWSWDGLKPVPKWIVGLHRLLRFERCRQNQIKQDFRTEKSAMVIGDGSTNKDDKVLKPENVQAWNEEQTEKTVAWTDVVAAMDMIFFVIFSLTLCVATVNLLPANG